MLYIIQCLCVASIHKETFKISRQDYYYYYQQIIDMKYFFSRLQAIREILWYFDQKV